jgi:hypothetical protein
MLSSEDMRLVLIETRVKAWEGEGEKAFESKPRSGLR